MENIQSYEPKRMEYNDFPTGDIYIFWSVGYEHLSVDTTYIIKNINTGEIFKTSKESYNKLIQNHRIKDNCV